MGFSSAKEELKVIVCDPRLMRRFRELASLFKIEYSVPKDPEGTVEGGIVIADQECAELFKIRSDTIHLVTSNNLLDTILRLRGINKVKVLIVGLDPGARLAFAIFADDVLIDTGHVTNYTNFIERLDSLVNELKPEKVIVKVGMPSTQEYYTWLSSLLIELIDRTFDVYLVEETKTSYPPIREFPGINYTRSKDIDAAINIALREGIKVGGGED